jgi:hypothetical protein
MAIFLDRIDAVPVLKTEFPFEYTSWVTNLVDTLNIDLQNIQDALNLFDNGLIAPSFTDVQIAAMAATLPDGIILYDNVNNEYVGKISGTLVSFQTGAYP